MQPPRSVNPASSSPSDPSAFVRSYRSSLKAHLAAAAGPDSKAARRLGQRALKLGLGILSLAKVHEDVVAGLRASSKTAATADSLPGEFFDAAVSPLMESRLTASEWSGHPEHTIESLKRRTEDLAATNAELLEEIGRRKEVERALRTSETTSSSLLKESLRLQEELRSLSRRLLTVQEDERRRISRELHDVVAQTLAGINVRLAVLRSQTSANVRDFQKKIEVTERLVAQSVEIVHRFASDLRPLVLDDLGLIPALKSFIKTFQARAHVTTKLTASSAVETLNLPARTALYRIAQEALVNAARHAKASEVRIDLRPGKGCVRMRIRDNGEGFDPEGHDPGADGGNLGLLGMRERAEMVGGSFRIESSPGAGTVVSVAVPYANPAPDSQPDPGTKPPEESR